MSAHSVAISGRGHCLSRTRGCLDSSSAIGASEGEVFRVYSRRVKPGDVAGPCLLRAVERSKGLCHPRRPSTTRRATGPGGGGCAPGALFMTRINPHPWRQPAPPSGTTASPKLRSPTAEKASMSERSARGFARCVCGRDQAAGRTGM